ncbi:hypothetical protein IAT38_001406 [Cryptococcus sp. DSM 104549]
MTDLQQLDKDRRRGLTPDTAVTEADTTRPPITTDKTPLRSDTLLAPSSQTPAQEVGEDGVKAKHPLQSTAEKTTDEAGEYFLDGEMRHTGVDFAMPAKEKTFSLQDIVSNHSEIALIIAASRHVDHEWLGSIFPSPKDVPTVMILSSRYSAQDPSAKAKAILQDSGAVWLYPNEIMGGSMHMHWIWVLYTNGRLRVAIMTANLNPYDWSRVENTIFLQDFLPLSPGAPPALHSPHSPPRDFPRQLSLLYDELQIVQAFSVLHSDHRHALSTIPQNMMSYQGFSKTMRFYCWDRVKGRLVVSRPGQHGESSGRRDMFGLARLARVLKEEGLVPGKHEKVEVEYNTVMLGRYALDWLTRFYSTCAGVSLDAPDHEVHPWEGLPLQIVYPSLTTVDATVLGREGGIIMRGQGFSESTRGVFHESRSKRGGVMIYSKMMVTLIKPREPSSETNVERGWVLVGSHSLTGSAWGWPTSRGKALRVKNFELGIVLPFEGRDVEAVADRIALWKRPASLYTSQDVAWEAD